jgi:hypothetical protein
VLLELELELLLEDDEDELLDEELELELLDEELDDELLDEELDDELLDDELLLLDDDELLQPRKNSPVSSTSTS